LKAFTNAYPCCYSGTAYSPTVHPVVTVIYGGSNDFPLTQAAVEGLLVAVRAAHPQTVIFAINPHGLSWYPLISAAVATQNDPRMFALDYGTGVVDSGDKTDGEHLNPGGHVALAVRLAGDIQSHLAALGIREQSGGGPSTGPNTMQIEANVNAPQSLSPIVAASVHVLLGAGAGKVLITNGNAGVTQITATTDSAGNCTLVLSPPA
jgi:hypothetical protein